VSNIYVGLNTRRLFSDVASPSESLDALGLNIEDVRLLNGENSELGDALIDIPLDPEELRTLSGLDVDAPKELYSLVRSVSRLNQNAADISDINNSLRFNIRINDQIRAGAIKYKFLDFSDSSIRSGDISTARNSSWSGDSNNIFYGGEVEVVPNGNNSNIDLNTLNLDREPQPLKFPNLADTPEVPTHLITITVDGVDRQFYAMKGIPLRWRGFFQNATSSNPNINFSDVTGASGSGGSGLYCSVNPIGSAQARWIIRNTNDGQEFVSEPGAETFFFTNVTTEERDVELYYNPDEIVKLGVEGLNISDIARTVMDNLEYYNLALNDLSETPNFNLYAPNLISLRLNGNNLSRARDTNGDFISANTQLNDNLPATLRYLDINGCFSDDVPIDIANTCTELRWFNMNSYYLTYSQRIMKYGGPEAVSPAVANTIQHYSVENQPHTRLSQTVVNAPNLKYLDIAKNRISGAENTNAPANTDPVPISLASTELETFLSNDNPHNLIQVVGKEKLRVYRHQDSRSLLGGDLNNNINTIFGTNPVLEEINLYRTDAAGTINTAFAGLPALEILETRFTRMEGKLVDGSFAGTNNLRILRIAGSRFNDPDFFSVSSGTGACFSGLTQLRDVFVYSNRNIGGSLPSFSTNTNLTTLVISNTSLGGSVPLFAGNPNLSRLLLVNSEFTGPVPSFTGPNWRVIALNSNQLSGDFSITTFDCPNLSVLRVGYNDLSGSLPSFSLCRRMLNLLCQGNQISGYTDGALSQNTNLRNFDISNNELSGSGAGAIFVDLIDNYNARPRSGVTINMSGNNFAENSTDLSAETLTRIATLRSLGWTIII
jgi:hypothetical protein